ncbi:MAG: glycosyltransferase family 39 protein [Chloroflexi bacterium]|nr:glycosyltransferase family 39 protein [Chloroflexota bacterium]
MSSEKIGGRFSRPLDRRASFIPFSAGLLWLLAHALLFAGQDVALRSVAAFALVAPLPGLALAQSLLDPDEDLVEGLLYSAGLGYALLIVGTLAVHYLPGRITPLLLLGLYDALFVALMLAWWRRGNPLRWRIWAVSIRQREAIALLTLLGIAVYLRFMHLGYAEFQGDEITLVHLAAEAIEGHDQALFYHKKGPAEILLMLPGYALTGRLNELAGRIPFALANLLGVTGLYALGRRFFSAQAGWWAALLIAMNGFYVAFGRIMQYQSLIFFFGALGVLAALRFSQDTRQRWLWCSAAFLTMGLLAHSDGIFATLAAGVVVLWTLWRRAGAQGMAPLRALWDRLAMPALAAAATLAAFYVPFVLHPQFSNTQGYLRWRMGEPPYNNLGAFLHIGTVYNAVYYYSLLAFFLLSMIWRRMRIAHKWGWALPALWLLALSSIWALPDLWLVRGRSLAGVLFLAAFVALLALGKGGLAWNTTLIWFAVPFMSYFFGFRDPRTHYYVLFAAASLLVGAELDALTTRLRGIGRGVAYAAIALILGVSLAYQQIMFVSHTPEYRRTYPQHRISFYWVPFGDELPAHGLFGFPYRAGWKAIGHLYATGQLVGSFDANEESHITRWYTRAQPECAPFPTYYFIAKNVQDEQPLPMAEIERDYELIGHVLVAGEPKIDIYEHKPARTPHQDYRLEEHIRAFDRELSGTAYTTRLLPFVNGEAAIQHPARLKLGSWIEFLGYSVDRTELYPGETLNLTLYWQAVAPVPESFTVFTHIEDPGVLWSQDDGVPGCGSLPTHEWRLARPYADQYHLTIGPDTPPGPHGLVVGMYRLTTGERLPVADAQGNPLGDSIPLGSVTVLPARER